MSEFITHNLHLLIYVFVTLTTITYLLTGLLYFRDAVHRRDFDLAMAILLVLYGIVLVLLPVDYYLWNYFGIGFAILFFAFVLKAYFGDIMMTGSIKQKIFVILCLIILLLIIIFTPYIKFPAFFDYIPAF